MYRYVTVRLPSIWSTFANVRIVPIGSDQKYIYGHRRNGSSATPEEMDCEPSMGFMQTAEQLVGYVSFPVDRFSEGSMERFSRNFVQVMQTLLESPETQVTSMVLE